MNNTLALALCLCIVSIMLVSCANNIPSNSTYCGKVGPESKKDSDYPADFHCFMTAFTQCQPAYIEKVKAAPGDSFNARWIIERDCSIHHYLQYDHGELQEQTCNDLFYNFFLIHNNSTMEVLEFRQCTQKDHDLFSLASEQPFVNPLGPHEQKKPATSLTTITGSSDVTVTNVSVDEEQVTMKIEIG